MMQRIYKFNALYLQEKKLPHEENFNCLCNSISHFSKLC